MELADRGRCVDAARGGVCSTASQWLAQRRSVVVAPRSRAAAAAAPVPRRERATGSFVAITGREPKIFWLQS